MPLWPIIIYEIMQIKTPCSYASRFFFAIINFINTQMPLSVHNLLYIVFSKHFRMSSDMYIHVKYVHKRYKNRSFSLIPILVLL